MYFPEGILAGSYENSNEPLGSVRDGEFVD
jgi:hypothetical protein